MTDSIAHAHTKRPDTGVSNAQLGMWLFLASDAMLMASLFSGYVLLRESALNMPALPWSWLRVTLEAVLLLGATVAIWVLGHSFRAHFKITGRGGPSGPPRATLGGAKAPPLPQPGAGDNAAYGGHHFSGAERRFLVVSSAAAFAAALIPSLELVRTFNAGVRPADHVLIASWFTLRTAHAMHVAVGALALGWIARQMTKGATPRLLARLGAVRLYWYVLLVMWVVMVIAFGV